MSTVPVLATPSSGLAADNHGYPTYPSSPRCENMVRKAGPSRHKRLVSLGWTFAESPDVGSANAHTNPYTKQIVYSPRCAARQSKRDIYYVTEHEVGHALDFEAGTCSRMLGTKIGLNPPSAQECLAEAVAYWSRKSSSERTWIISAIGWHVRQSVRWRYSWTHVRRPETVEMADMLVWGPDDANSTKKRRFWKWSGNLIVPI